MRARHVAGDGRRMVRRGSPIPFWLDPMVLILIVLSVSLLAFLLIPTEVFQRDFRQPKHPFDLVLWIYLFSGLFLLAGVLAFKGRRRHFSPRARYILPVDSFERGALRAFAGTALTLSLLAYAVFIAASNVSISLVLASFSGSRLANYVLKASFESIPGVTSFMNLAPWWFVWVAYKKFVEQKPLNRWEIAGSAVLLSLSVFRGFAVNERRVLFELVIPSAVTVLMMRRDWSVQMRRLFAWAPFVGAFSLAVVFLATEYFRTWTSFWRYNTDLGYVEWALSRMGGYYATALNNAAAILSSDVETYGALSLRGLFRMPLIADVFGLTPLRLEAERGLTWTLRNYANPEFNNPGGLAVVVIDFGWFAAAPILFALGAVIGIAYRFANQGFLASTLFYSWLVFGILELTRVLAFFDPFGLINLLFLLGFALVLVWGGEITRKQTGRQSRF